MKRVFDLHVNARHPAIPSEYPYATALCPRGKTLYVSLHNGSAVAVVDLASGAVSLVPVGRQQEFASAPSSHPSHLAFNPSGSAVYVAVENSDLITVIDNEPSSARYRQVVANIDVRPTEMRDMKILGAGPNHLTFTPDGRILLVSLGLLNAVAVVQVEPGGARAQHEVRGFLPTLWYPHTMEVSPRREDRLSDQRKGQRHRVQPTQPAVSSRAAAGALRSHAAQGITARSLARIRPWLKSTGSPPRQSGTPSWMPQSLAAAGKSLDFNPIKHVIYVIKENRTYDQILGDLEKGQGGQDLPLFRREIHPQPARLARQFGIYDNFFVSAEVSFNGHTWSTAGINSGWNEQQWQINYSTQNFTYDSEGRNNQILPVEHGQSDVDTPQGGYIWDTVIAAGKNIGMYGEFCDNPRTPLKMLRKGDPLPGLPVAPANSGPTSQYRLGSPAFGRSGSERASSSAVRSPPRRPSRTPTSRCFRIIELLHPDVLRYLVWKRDFDRIATEQKESGKDQHAGLQHRSARHQSHARRGPGRADPGCQRGRQRSGAGHACRGHLRQRVLLGQYGDHRSGG